MKVTLQSLHDSYEDWLIHQKQGPLPAQVLVLDADKGIDHMITTYEQYKVSAGIWDNNRLNDGTFQDEIRGIKPYSPRLIEGQVKTLIS